MNYSIIGNTIMMRMDFFEEKMEMAAATGARVGVEKYREEKMKGEKLSVQKAAKELDLSDQTLIRYIHFGKRVRGRQINV